MNNSAAFFQILYQNETLFQLAEPVIKELEETHVKTPEFAGENEKLLQPAAAVLEVQRKPDVTPSRPEVVPNIAQQVFPTLKHKVLILLDEPKQQGMLVSEALFLDNILKAVGHAVETTDVLNFSFLPTQDARKVLSEKKTHFFITFGVPLIRLHLDLLLAPYTPKLVDGIWFLLTDPLVVIEADRNLKKKLWQALQKMFEMS
ncbi:hypothetical protein [Dyadobacter arcticus]|uniref:Uncharacterized protein n=1 Tax=Dyadobacter arcticus TaxID=1078754 RepID=A0ABX0UVI3_9BACT|nr:hypothetical protein [Dyadobacter arcticus]NIJ55884.1 hypothetical protein [Dyadobacter arcticus]